jgi:hypothetical protein
MTPKEINLKEIHLLLETFQEQFQQACDQPGAVPLIEMDLMKQTIRNLYSQLDLLGKLKEGSVPSPAAKTIQQEVVTPPTQATVSIPVTIVAEEAAPVTAPQQKEIKPEMPVAEPTKELELPTETILVNKQESIVGTTNDIFLTQQETIVIQSATNDTETAKAEKTITVTETTKVTRPEVKKGIVAGLFDEAPSVASKFNSSETIYDKIAKTKQDPSVAEKLTMQPVEDLKKSIGINARFAFINELFSGDQMLFHDSIERINKSSAFEEARKVLYEDLADKMKWNTSSKPFSELEELVKRRFGV